MNKTVYKYPLKSSTTAVELPKDAQLLKVDDQHGKITLWALVSPDNAPEVRNIEVFGTGHSISDPDTLKYINTFFVQGGNYVFHAFERV